MSPHRFDRAFVRHTGNAIAYSLPGKGRNDHTKAYLVCRNVVITFRVMYEILHHVERDEYGKATSGSGLNRLKSLVGKDHGGDA